MMQKGETERGERGVEVIAGRGRKRRGSEVIWSINSRKTIARNTKLLNS